MGRHLRRGWYGLPPRLRNRHPNGRNYYADGRSMGELGTTPGGRLKVQATKVENAQGEAWLLGSREGERAADRKCSLPLEGMAMALEVLRTSTPRPRVPDDQLGFGQVFADHMLLMDYTTQAGWHQARIEPYGPFSLEPST